jgi:murein DD-endopeptidase MepM/ murein hydrolase activator NlpD
LISRLSYRWHTILEARLPEQRLFLKSDTTTRFIRLRSSTQAIAIAGAGLLLVWTIVATAMVLMDWVNAGSSRDLAAQRQAMFEERLNALSADRDLRAEEAAGAQQRFNVALEQVSAMQARLLASEDRRRELETGIETLQDTLRRVTEQRDDARAIALAATEELEATTGTTRTADERAAEAEATVAFLTSALGQTAGERDLMQGAVELANARAAEVARDLAQVLENNDEIFTRLEEAVTVSMEPLDNVFRAAGLSPSDLLDTIRRGYSGQGGPLSPLTLSTSGAAPSPDELRANAILERLDEMNMYRIAAGQVPLAMPVFGNFRFTSGFGYRRDPKGWGTRMHNGTDMAGPHGMPIHATADGTVIEAGWDSGYGRAVRIRHAFGIETLYAHMSAINVNVGEKVSRGDVIGAMGSTGRSTGTHLHYEIHVGGTPVNPMTFIKAGQNVF